ncbi:MAG: deoxyribodipyrimidine photo-lyase [Flavobacteriaceae bacterium]|nr:deoxyribodipyrimidine photo-lyase [Flavobacteriaceae bacterium]
MKQKVVLFWFRRDLRLEDNAGLYAALNGPFPVLPIFVYDTAILEKLPKKDARLDFIHTSIAHLQKQLQPLGKSMTTFQGNPLQVIEKLLDTFAVQKVVTNRDYEPYARDRDSKIASFLESKGIEFETHKDHVLFEKSEVTKDDGLPYKVYTPYSRKWMAALDNTGIKHFPSENCLERLLAYDQALLTLEKIGFSEASHRAPAYNISNDIIDQYEARRNFPAVAGTSKLGVHLRFGTVSTRKMVEKAKKSNDITFLKELIWREFFQQILWHFPHTQTDCFKPQYERLEWRNNEDEFKKWCEGKTGYPFVDAGMRELNATGFMHNRVRMLVGSFLCKHLLIDWRWGEAYFAEKLLDYEMASNVGNWQWVAGCGVDAAPYFRVFNPTDQIKKFDKAHEYIKKWVPEYQELNYPMPIVEHKMARERCLEVYKSALK